MQEFRSAAQPVVSACDVDPVLTCTLHATRIRTSGYIDCHRYITVELGP